MVHNLVLNHIILRYVYLIFHRKIQNNLLSKLKTIILEALGHSGHVSWSDNTHEFSDTKFRPFILERPGLDAI